MDYTIKELCDFLETEVPKSLLAVQDTIVKGINARYTTLEKGDAFFDINNDCENLSLVNATLCPFIISEREIDEDNINIPVVKINNALDRYVSLCKTFVDEYPDTVRIAITGSTGKTSMKESIAAILSEVSATDKTFSNQNNLYYISKRYQTVFKKNLHFYVQEASAKAYEDINLTQKLAQAYQPNIVVMTNIHDNHTEIFGSRENIFKIKSSLVEEMGSKGIAFLNYDDDYLKEYHPNCKTVYYSLENPSADIYASNIKVSNEGTSFDINWQGRVIENLFCKMIGRTNVYNFMIAFAIGSLYGADDELLVRTIAGYNINYSLRQNHAKIGKFNLFVDCFNASFESVKNDLIIMENLSPDEGGRKIAVLGDIAELGEQAEEVHRKIGALTTHYNIDKFFYLGQFNKIVFEAAINEIPNAPLCVFESRAEFESALKNYIKPGDLILWKASHGTHLEKSIDSIFGTDFYSMYPEDYDTETLVHGYPYESNNANIVRNYVAGKPVGGQLGKKAIGKEFEYCIYDNGIKYVRNTSQMRDIIIPGDIDGAMIRSIGDRAFYKSNIISITCPNTIVNISTNAFLRSNSLRNVSLSQNTKYIDFSAFAYCTCLEKIVIPESCLLVRRRAFLGCKRLQIVDVQGKDTLLEDGVFEETEKVRIKCRKNSLAEQFAIENAITYCVVNDKGIESDWIIPQEKEKEIVINDFFWEEIGGQSRLNINIEIDGVSDTLWYQFDNKYKRFANDDRIDAVVVSFLLFAIRGKFSRIRSNYPISEKLKYQLEQHLIPQIVDFEGENKAKRVVIDAPTTNVVYENEHKTNSTGFSRGVDSFATLYEYGKNSSLPDSYKVDFLNVYNVGAFHGKDVGKRSVKLSKELFSEQAEATVEFAENNGYHALVVDSNLAMLLKSHFSTPLYGKLIKFQNSATERNIGTTLLFQKLFNRFYYASGHTLKEFKLSLDDSSALWEQYGVQFFSTENTSFYIANRDWTRMEKVQRVVQLPEAYDNLQVCLLETGNCGTCMKCKRTLMNLDVLGEDNLDKFAASFDLRKYKEEHRKEFFESLWDDKDHDEYAKDIFSAAVKNGSELLVDQQIEGEGLDYVYRHKVSRISIMSLPTYASEEIGFLINDQSDIELKILGKTRKTWYQVLMPDGRKGYINQKNISVSEFKAAQSLALNADTELKLTLGKKYGFMPRFNPSDANEQVSYSLDNPSVAYINKSGWIYTVAIGKTTVTAVSSSGLTAKCIVEVCPPKIKLQEKGFKAVVKRVLPAKAKTWIKKNILK